MTKMKTRNKNPDTGKLIEIYNKSLKLTAVAEAYDNGKVFGVRLVGPRGFNEGDLSETEYVSRKELDKIIEAIQANIEVEDGS
jgi:hypothetical protein